MELITGRLGAFLLFAITASQTAPEFNAQIGGSFTLPLDYKPLSRSDEIKWKHGEFVILHRKKQTFSRGKKEDINAVGSLILRDLKPQNTGTYVAEVYDEEGRRQTIWTGQLSVLEKVNKPTVKFVCPTGKSTSVSFTCEVPQNTDLTFSWNLNGKDIDEKKATMKRELQDVITVSCSAKSKLNQETSYSVSPSCGGFNIPSELLGLEFWTMVAILAGGGGFLILLLAVVLVCCCRAQSRSQRRKEEEEELRLQWSKPQPEAEPTSTASKQGIPKHPTPRARGQAAAQPGPRALDRPPQAGSRENDEEDPPPLPKPRKKGQRPPDNAC